MVKSHGTQTRAGLRWRVPAAIVNYRPVLSSERALQNNKPANSLKKMSRRKNNWSTVPDGCLTPKRTGRLTVGRNLTQLQLDTIFWYTCRTKMINNELISSVVAVLMQVPQTALVRVWPSEGLSWVLRLSQGTWLVIVDVLNGPSLCDSCVLLLMNDARVTLLRVTLSAVGISRWPLPFDPNFVHYLVSDCAFVWWDELPRDKLLSGAGGMLR
jgi:hypothetical protein